MFIIAHKKYFITAAAFLVLAAVFFIFYDGLNLSVDFTGGSVLEVRYSAGSPSRAELLEAVSSVLGPNVSVRETENGFRIQTALLDAQQRSALLETLDLEGRYGQFSEERFSSIGPAVGRELQHKALLAIALVIVAVVLFVAFAFRQVSRPVSSWTYGLVVIVTLFHDIVVPTGLFAFLGVVLGWQIDMLFVTALLVILGYSVNDTIVVFDRIRENLFRNQQRGRDEKFAKVVADSLKETYVRSINTSLTTILVLLALLLGPGDAVRNFVITLIAGVAVGTYSSIFLASPLLVWIEERRARKIKRKE